MTIAMDRVANDSHEKFLSAGVTLIAKRGIDTITVADISRESGLTRATFYSYFGDLDGLFAEIWLLHGRRWLEDLSIFSMQNPIEQEKNSFIATLDIFIASKRKPVVLEVVAPTVASWWNNATNGNRAETAKLAWVVAGNIGIALSKHLSPSINEVSEVVSLLAQLPSEENVLDEMGLMPSAGSSTLKAVLGSPETKDLTDDQRIKSSTIEVVASAGVANASMTRIARNLKVTTGSVYPKYKNISEIIGEAFNWGQTTIVEENTAAYASTRSNADSYASVIVGANADSRKVWRDFRLEMYLASRVNEPLSKAMLPGLNKADSLLETFARKNGLPEKYIGQIVGLMHALGVGFPALQNVGVFVQNIEHRIPTRYLVSVMSNASNSKLDYSVLKALEPQAVAGN